MATTARRKATEEDLLAMPDDGQKYELVDGEIRGVSPAGLGHGRLCVSLTLRLGTCVQERALGLVVDSSTGFRLPNGNVRSPDVAFIAAGRFTGDDLRAGFCPVPPDLAIEVLSPTDRRRHVLDKVGEYLDAGVPLVWVIDPAARKATVYRSITNVTTVGEDGSLDGEDVLPGFRCPLRDIL
jgi:Uma2 family endonuclease